MWNSFPRTTAAILILPWTCFKECKSQRSILYSPATQWEPNWPLLKTFHEDCFHNYKVTAPRSLETEDFFFLHVLFLQMHWQISWEVQRKGTELGHEEGTAQVNRTRVSPQAIWSYTWHSSIKDSGTSGTKENSTSSRITAHSRRQANCIGAQLGSFYLQIFCGMQVMVTARYKRSTQKERNRLKGQM